MKEVEAAKADGRWDRAYDSASSMRVPADFLNESRTINRAGILCNLKQSKHLRDRVAFANSSETRDETKRRMETISEMLVASAKSRNPRRDSGA